MTPQAAKALSAKLLAEDGLNNAAEVLQTFIDEEVTTGNYIAMKNARLAQRKGFFNQRRSFLKGGFLGGLGSAAYLFRAMLLKWV